MGDQSDICLWKIANSLAILRLRKALKTSTRLAGHGIWTRDLPNASLVRYHGATSLGALYLCPILITNFCNFFSIRYFSVLYAGHCIKIHIGEENHLFFLLVSKKIFVFLPYIWSEYFFRRTVHTFSWEVNKFDQSRSKIKSSFAQTRVSRV